MVSRKKLKLVHTSDTHLGGDWHPELSQNALETVVRGVKMLKADALLIVGDVFDHARVSDGLLEFFLEQMALLKVPAVVLPGNHDIYDQDSLYFRPPFRQAPANLHIFNQLDGQFISFPELTLNVWGRAMTMHTPEFRPLEGMTPAPNGNWLVALAHGHFHFDDDKETRSAPDLSRRGGPGSLRLSGIGALGPPCRCLPGAGKGGLFRRAPGRHSEQRQRGVHPGGPGPGTWS